MLLELQAVRLIERLIPFFQTELACYTRQPIFIRVLFVTEQKTTLFEREDISLFLGFL